jgi:hypothetical protein
MPLLVHFEGKCKMKRILYFIPLFLLVACGGGGGGGDPSKYNACRIKSGVGSGYCSNIDSTSSLESAKSQCLAKIRNKYGNGWSGTYEVSSSKC